MLRKRCRRRMGGGLVVVSVGRARARARPDRAAICGEIDGSRASSTRDRGSGRARARCDSERAAQATASRAMALRAAGGNSDEARCGERRGGEDRRRLVVVAAKRLCAKRAGRRARGIDVGEHGARHRERRQRRLPGTRQALEVSVTASAALRLCKVIAAAVRVKVAATGRSAEGVSRSIHRRRVQAARDKEAVKVHRRHTHGVDVASDSGRRTAPSACARRARASFGRRWRRVAAGAAMPRAAAVSRRLVAHVSSAQFSREGAIAANDRGTTTARRPLTVTSVVEIEARRRASAVTSTSAATRRVARGGDSVVHGACSHVQMFSSRDAEQRLALSHACTSAASAPANAAAAHLVSAAHHAARLPYPDRRGSSTASAPARPDAAREGTARRKRLVLGGA